LKITTTFQIPDFLNIKPLTAPYVYSSDHFGMVFFLLYVLTICNRWWHSESKKKNCLCW